MDPELFDNSTKRAPRKVKFAPKAPPKREQKLVLPKVEKNENELDDAKAEHLLRRLNETSLTGKSKVERKAAPAQVAFGFGGSSSSIKSYGVPKGINRNQGSSSDGGLEQRVEKEYKEPWDYYTNYPATLPMRRPYSGNPELLDEEEFGEDQEYEENATNTAEELGLLDENLENNMFFLQLPPTFPGVMQSAKSEDGEMRNKEKTANDSGTSQKPCNLETLPAGLMGKMLVYRSGALKLKVGDTLYDVSAGLNCMFAQDAIAIDTERKHCCNLGELNKRVVVTPDIDNILDAIDDS